MFSYMRPNHLTKWSVLASCEQGFLDSITLVKFFGKNGESALITTEDDKVFVAGSIPPKFAVSQGNSLCPVEFPGLSGKNVIGFANGGSHWLALTEVGDVFAWGDNKVGQLGQGNTLEYNSLPLRVPHLPKVKIISCGDLFSLALTVENKVFAWGSNSYGQCGSNGEGPVLKPLRVQFPEDVTVFNISTGWSFATALGFDGKVYCWGWNRWGELGRKTDGGHDPEPKAVEIPSGVSRVCCGAIHALALTENGQVWAWGYNCKGMLGVNSTDEKVISPMKVEALAHTCDIMALWRYDLSLAQTGTHVFRWGAFTLKEEVEVKPVKLDEHVLVDALANRETESLFICNRSNEAEVGDPDFSRVDFAPLFNKREDSDVTIEVGDRRIFCHRIVLRSSCPHFQLLLSEPYLGCGERVIKVDEYTPELYFNFLEYVYRNKLKYDDILDLTEIYSIGSTYSYDKLTEAIKNVLKENLNENNAIQVYITLKKQQISDLEELTLQFIIKNFQQLAKTSSFKTLPAGDVVEITSKWAHSQK